MMKYTVLRIVIFLLCLTGLWVAGLRGQDKALLLVAGAAILSAVISYFALRRVREDYSAQLADRIARRTAAKRTRLDGGPTDEDVEDAEIAPDDGQFR